MDTACVSQRAHSYNPEIHPKESLLGKQAKNNPEGSSTAQKQFFGGGGIQGTSSVAYGVIASNFFKFRVASGGGSCPPDPAFWVPRHLALCHLLVAQGGLWQVGGLTPGILVGLVTTLWDVGYLSPVKDQDS